MNYRTYLFEAIFYAMNLLFKLQYSVMEWYDDNGERQKERVLLNEAHSIPLRKMHQWEWYMVLEEP